MVIGHVTVTLVVVTGASILVPASHRHSFEDQALIDEIYGCLVLRWVAETWLPDSLTVASPARRHGPSIMSDNDYVAIYVEDYKWVLVVPGPRLNIETVLSTYGDFHVKDKTAVRTSYL